MKALSFGEILWDVYPDERFIGGAPFNFAAHLARHRAEVCMLSAVGNDALGEETRTAVRGMGIIDRFIATVDEPTGRCLVTLGENGIPSYDLLQDVAYDSIPFDGCARDFDLFYFGSLALRSSHNRRTLQQLLAENTFGEVFVDVNIRPPFYSEETVAFCVENATILKISDEELPTVLELLNLNTDGTWENAAEMLAARCGNLKLILLTQGSAGAAVYECKTGRILACSAKQVNVASTVGAGDSFSAGFVYSYMNGEELSFCLEYASRLAAFVVSRQGAVPDYNPEEIGKK